MRAVLRFLLNVLAVVAGLWVTTALVPGVDVVPGPNLSREWAFVAVAVVFIVVGSIVGPILRFLGAPITCLTLGLFALVINAAIFAIVGWVSAQLGLGLIITGFWPALIGAAVLGVVRGLVGLVTDRV